MSKIQAKDFYNPTPFNEETKNQIWMSQIADAHDNICYCNHPFAHLLANIFPVGHKDRDLTINQILLRDYQEKCLSGGAAEESGGGAAAGTGGGFKGIKEESQEPDLPGDEIEELLTAAEKENDSR